MVREMVTLRDDKIGAGKGAIALQNHDGGGIKVNGGNIKIALPHKLLIYFLELGGYIPENGHYIRQISSSWHRSQGITFV